MKIQRGRRSLIHVSDNDSPNGGGMDKFCFGTTDLLLWKKIHDAWNSSYLNVKMGFSILVITVCHDHQQVLHVTFWVSEDWTGFKMAYAWPCQGKIVTSNIMVLKPLGGGGTPYDSLYREAPLDTGNFFRLQVYIRLGIPLVEVYKKAGKSLVWVCKRTQKS